MKIRPLQDRISLKRAAETPAARVCLKNGMGGMGGMMQPGSYIAFRRTSQKEL